MTRKQPAPDSSPEHAAPTDEPEPAPFELTLRDVEVPAPPAEQAAPVDDGLVVSDPEARPEPWLGDPDVERAAERAARRTQVREERARDAAPAAIAAPDMLVLHGDEAGGNELCDLLRAFGFGVRALYSAPPLAAPWPFAAIFVTAATGSAGGGDAIDLCNSVRERSRLPGTLTPRLVLVAEQLSATDRVRAGLAGCNEVIVGPVARGSVARALEAHGIALPSDARRA